MTPEQVNQIGDAINGVKFALLMVGWSITLHAMFSGPSMSGIQKALNNIADALRGKK